MKVSGIYKISSLCKPHRIYIGSSVAVYKRWNEHKRKLRKNKHHSLKLQRHYNKYGESDLVYEFIFFSHPSYVLQYEQYFIDTFKPYFNNSPTAGSNLGCKMSKEECRKRSVRAKLCAHPKHEGSFVNHYHEISKEDRDRIIKNNIAIREIEASKKGVFDIKIKYTIKK